ncbi:MAG: type II toxin-antitoxin system prevent-host-death family antitoxin [Candidatus Marinimicrobia bacterium]|jgi:prevent-host-death family protein|nr:type II toxin-antitoxin system prevent-host-death family antitoxin [Candidatus Neomarinimicrobiota bacterium]MBT3633154.1 type II toxin-antitoxin system prevent-host-death family antitoxin [Candidatus Neomarinimicrobiota bacterium]MBT3682245.1 type II toxin-antitoxin system prevent-host-death family antitoxin [Candidatus Neomarinimicrobiota bacterium]MBT3758754.1 type II toxin-antitoxin system prevent-host-death family antitoxin [Candidatus Neomarinimicrobiota bacterium]MBT3895372.1 type II 
MDTIAVSELRANLMKVLERVNNGDHIQITSRGKVIAQLMPSENIREKAKARLLTLSKTAKIIDVMNPIDETWDVFS